MQTETNFFADLESDLGPEVEATSNAAGYFTSQVAYADHATGYRANAERARKAAPMVACPKCKGSGMWTGYGDCTGDRSCTKCGGTGQVRGLLMDEASVARRAKAVAKKAADAQASVDRRTAWFDAHSDVVAWLGARSGHSSFANSLSVALENGPLSEGQINAVRRIIAEDAAKAEKLLALVAAPVQGLDLSALPAGRYAVPGGDTRLKILVRKPKTGNWAGFTFVSDAAAYGERQNYGRQAPGKAYTGSVVEALTAIVADPRAASAAYGTLTCTCGVCGRPLEDAASVAAGIGPVCAGKFE